MYFLAFLCALGLLTMWFDDILQDKANPNQDPTSQWINNQQVQVVLEQNAHGHYIANGTINQTPVTFLLDTGATSVSIPAHLQQQLALEKGYPQRVSTANGSVTVYATRLRTLTLGDIQLHDVRAHLNPGLKGNEILLGMSALRQLDFSQQNRTLILTQTVSI